MVSVGCQRISGRVVLAGLQSTSQATLFFPLRVGANPSEIEKIYIFSHYFVLREAQGNSVFFSPHEHPYYSNLQL